MIDYILLPQTVEALGWTLLHSIWQGAAFAIVLVLLLITLKRYSAQSRYIVSVGLLCAFFLTIATTFWQQWQVANGNMQLSSLEVKAGETAAHFELGNNSDKVISLSGERASTLPYREEVSLLEQSAWITSFREYFASHLPLLVTMWFLGVLFLQLRFLGQLAYVQRLKHYGTQLIPAAWNDRIEELEGKLRIRKKVSYLTSMRAESPMVIGWLKPVVLLPQQLFVSLSETEIYAVLAHELAHIRREDFIVNLIQTFLCNVFFFHPGVWWMSHRIDDEREHCCDDLAVAATGPAASYAKTLINISALQLNTQGANNLAMAFSGKSQKRERGGFSGRIHRLFKTNNNGGAFKEGFTTAFILISAILLGVGATGTTLDNENKDINSTVEDSVSSTKKEKTTTVVTTTITDKSGVVDAQEFTKIEVMPIASMQSFEPECEPVNSLPIAKPANPVGPMEPAKPMSPIKVDVTRIDALLMACEEGDLDFVKTLVGLGIDVNSLGSEGFTPLMAAAENNQAEVVDYLISQGADVNQSFNGWTALIEAADEGSLESMEHLLDAGANVNYYWTQDSPTATTMAASENNLNCLELLLNSGADINGVGSSLPPLHIASEEGNRDVVKYLIENGVNLNGKDASGRTALMYAASEGNKAIVKVLIAAGADKSLSDNEGNNAKDYAIEEDQYSISDYLGSEKKPQIHRATSNGQIEKVQEMVENGADVNTRDDYGRTALHIASAKGHDIDMRVLMDLGADVDAQDSQGRTPLMYAAADGKADASVLLVSKLANVQLADVDGMRAFEWAQSGGNSDLTKFLGLITNEKSKQSQKQGFKSGQNNESKRVQKEEIIQVQVQIENAIEKITENFGEKNQEKEYKSSESFHVDGNGYHLRQYDIDDKMDELFDAIKEGSISDCRYLLNKGIPVNSSDETGQTPLMVAARSNQIEVAQFLINNGADVNKSSMSGLTALHYAALENYKNMAQLLLDNNAYVDATMKYSSTDGNFTDEPLVWEYNGATPLLIAAESGNVEVLSVLIKAGANTNHKLSKNEYRLHKDRVSYLSGGEVMGLDDDFLKDVEVKISDHTWTPYKQALLLNNKEILIFFPQK